MKRPVFLEPESLKGAPYRGALPPARELIGLVLLAIMLFTAFNTIESARWIKNLPPLLLPIVLSLALSYYLTSREFSWKVSLPAVIATGIVLTLALGLWRLSGAAQVTMGLFILMTAWWSAYVTLRLAYRGSSPVLIALPGLVVLLVTLAFLSSDYFLRLPLYLLAAAPAMAHFHWRRWGGESSLIPRLVPLGAGLVLMGGAVAFSWPAPTPEESIRPAAANRLEEPLYKLWERTADIFKKLPSRKGWPRFNPEPQLPFTGLVEPGDDVLMLVKADKPNKWRVRVYETYTPEGWTGIPEGLRISPSTASHATELEGDNEREEVKIEVRILSSNSHMASAGIPLKSSISGLAELSPVPSFSLALEGEQATFLPPDVMDFRSGLLEDQISEGDEVPLSERLDFAGLKLSDTQSSEDQPLAGFMAVERVEEVATPSVALLFFKRQAPPRSYVTTGSVSTALPSKLRQASQSYPTWITDRYLQLPPDFSERVKDLARELTQGQDNAYAIALSIQDYLHTIPYSTEVVPPPPGYDPVEWFIDVQHVGFCTYYASAMITMLRSLDIPARLVVGFVPGDWDDQRQAWVVKSKHYHAWPEVYFPGYGWVEFEPTPAGVQPGLEYLGLGSRDLATPANMGSVDECFLFGIYCEGGADASLEEGFGLSDEDSKDEDEVPALVDGGSGFMIWLALILGLAAVAALGTKLYFAFLTRRLGAPVVVYYSMSLLATLGGVPRRPHYTPAEYGSRLAAFLPDHDGPIGEVTKAYEVDRYSRSKWREDDRDYRLRTSWKTLRWALIGLILRRMVPRPPSGRRRDI